MIFVVTGKFSSLVEASPHSVRVAKTASVSNTPSVLHTGGYTTDIGCTTVGTPMRSLVSALLFRSVAGVSPLRSPIEAETYASHSMCGSLPSRTGGIEFGGLARGPGRWKFHAAT